MLVLRKSRRNVTAAVAAELAGRVAKENYHVTYRRRLGLEIGRHSGKPSRSSLHQRCSVAGERVSLSNWANDGRSTVPNS